MKATTAARILMLTAVATLLTACPKPTRPPAPAPSIPSAPAADVREAAIYDVNPRDSTLHILVYRGGALARLGHNHVMTVRDLQGRIWSHATLAKSGFDISFPVAQMVVDDPDARRAAGSDFPPDVPDADREGTRKNMLRAEVLDAAHYPRIEMKSVTLAGSARNPEASVRITIRNASRDISLKPSIRVDGNRLTATGELDLLQSDFGIKPFSAALGALTVQDRLHVKFNVVATRRQGT